MKNEKKQKQNKIRTQNTHEFKSIFILNKKEHKPRKFNHNNPNPKKKKKNYRQEHKLFLHFLILRTKHKLPAKTSNQTPPKPAKTSPITPLKKGRKKFSVFKISPLMSLPLHRKNT